MIGHIYFLSIEKSWKGGRHAPKSILYHSRLPYSIFYTTIHLSYYSHILIDNIFIYAHGFLIRFTSLYTTTKYIGFYIVLIGSLLCSPFRYTDGTVGGYGYLSRLPATVYSFNPHCVIEQSLVVTTRITSSYSLLFLSYLL